MKCLKFNVSMYGTRCAALGLHEHFVRFGSMQGKASPWIFHRPQRDIEVSIHGGDYVASALGHELNLFSKQMQYHYECKAQIMGPDEGDDGMVKVPNRIVTWQKGGGDDMITYEAHPRHPEIRAKEMGLEAAKP